MTNQLARTQAAGPAGVRQGESRPATGLGTGFVSSIGGCSVLAQPGNGK
jgi:hypothetical protein